MRVTFVGARRPAVRAAAAAAGACADADAVIDAPPSAPPTTPPTVFAKLLRSIAISPHAGGLYARTTSRRGVCDDSGGRSAHDSMADGACGGRGCGRDFI